MGSEEKNSGWTRNDTKWLVLLMVFAALTFFSTNTNSSTPNHSSYELPPAPPQKLAAPVGGDSDGVDKLMERLGQLEETIRSSGSQSQGVGKAAAAPAPPAAVRTVGKPKRSDGGDLLSKRTYGGESIRFTNIHTTKTPPFFMVNQNDKLSDDIYDFVLGSGMEDGVIRFFDKHLDNEKIMKIQKETPERVVVLDVGANHGFFALYAGARGYNTFAVDPQPHCAFYVQAASVLSGFDSYLTVHNKFIGEARGAIDVETRTGCWGTFPYTEQYVLDRAVTGYDHKETLPVSTLPLDDLVGEDKIVPVMKMDVEGHDCAALRSAARLLGTGQIWAMNVEWNKRQWTREGVSLEEVRDLTAWIMGLGYQFRASVYGEKSDYLKIDQLDKLLSEGWVTLEATFELPEDLRKK